MLSPLEQVSCDFPPHGTSTPQPHIYIYSVCTQQMAWLLFSRCVSIETEHLLSPNALTSTYSISELVLYDILDGTSRDYFDRNYRQLEFPRPQLENPPNYSYQYMLLRIPMWPSLHDPGTVSPPVHCAGYTEAYNFFISCYARAFCARICNLLVLYVAAVVLHFACFQKPHRKNDKNGGLRWWLHLVLYMMKPCYIYPVTVLYICLVGPCGRIQQYRADIDHACFDTFKISSKSHWNNAYDAY